MELALAVASSFARTMNGLTRSYLAPSARRGRHQFGEKVATPNRAVRTGLEDSDPHG
jgi:hypothetical protein